MNKFSALVAVVVLLLGVMGVWVFRSAQATAELTVKPYTPFTDLRLLAATPTAAADRHDLNVGRYLAGQTDTQEPDRHDRNVLRYIFENWGGE